MLFSIHVRLFLLTQFGKYVIEIKKYFSNVCSFFNFGFRIIEWQTHNCTLFDIFFSSILIKSDWIDFLNEYRTYRILIYFALVKVSWNMPKSMFQRSHNQQKAIRNGNSIDFFNKILRYWNESIDGWINHLQPINNNNYNRWIIRLTSETNCNSKAIINTVHKTHNAQLPHKHNKTQFIFIEHNLIFTRIL